MKRVLTEGEELTGNRHTYSVREHLGEGGFAKAWVGETTTGHTYCLKQPNYDSPRMDAQTIQEYFNQERRILSDLQSTVKLSTNSTTFGWPPADWRSERIRRSWLKYS